MSFRRWRIGRGTVIAVNVGGAVIPGLLSFYLLIRYRLWLLGGLAIAIVTFVCHLLAQPIPGLGIALPVFVPPLSAAMVALILSRPHAPALAYIGGSIGCLVGADLLNLGKIQGPGAPVASIGGAGPLMGFFSPALSRCSLPAYSAHPATSMAKLPERRFDPGGDRRQLPAASRHIACR